MFFSRVTWPEEEEELLNRAGLLLLLCKQVTGRTGLEKGSQGVKMSLAALERKNNYWGFVSAKQREYPFKLCNLSQNTAFLPVFSK